MMQIRIKEDSAEIEGYVNAIERKSKPLKSRTGQFVERICKGAFKRAIERNDDVHLLLNHNWQRDLGGTKTGNLELVEDSIGLKARATITDTDVIEKARHGDLVGWSFGFSDRDVDSHDENGILTRDVKDLDLYEVSILDRTRSPAYEGTLIAVRDDIPQYCGETMIDEIEIRDIPKVDQANETPATTPVDIDYSSYDAIINEMKGVKTE